MKNTKIETADERTRRHDKEVQESRIKETLTSDESSRRSNFEAWKGTQTISVEIHSPNDATPIDLTFRCSLCKKDFKVVLNRGGELVYLDSNKKVSSTGYCFECEEAIEKAEDEAKTKAKEETLAKLAR